jgi:hypothetical protein
MQWFKDLRTATKLVLCFAVLALLTAVVGYLGIRGRANPFFASLRRRPSRFFRGTPRSGASTCFRDTTRYCESVREQC